MGNMPDFRVKTVVEVAGGKERWVEIGVAFRNRDSISVKLDALPVNGKIVLLPLRERDDDKNGSDRDDFGPDY